MMHNRRVFRVVENHYSASPEALAKTLTEHDWCTCNGFRLGPLAFLNDSTSADGAQEYAVYDTRTGHQIESLTVSWMTAERLEACIRRLLSLAPHEVFEMGAGMPSFAHPEGSCHACA